MTYIEKLRKEFREHFIDRLGWRGGFLTPAHEDRLVRETDRAIKLLSQCRC